MELIEYGFVFVLSIVAGIVGTTIVHWVFE